MHKTLLQSNTIAKSASTYNFAICIWAIQLLKCNIPLFSRQVRLYIQPCCRAMHLLKIQHSIIFKVSTTIHTTLLIAHNATFDYFQGKYDCSYKQLYYIGNAIAENATFSSFQGTCCTGQNNCSKCNVPLFLR